LCHRSITASSSRRRWCCGKFRRADAVHSNAAVTERLVGILGVDRGDVRPDAIFGIEFPNRAIVHRIGAWLPAIAQIEHSVRRPHDVVGAQPHRLVRDRQPSDAAIGAAIKIGSRRGRRRVNRGSRTAGLAAGGVKHHAHDADRLLAETAETRAGIGGRAGRRRRWVGCADVGKTFNFLPRRCPVGAFPQSILARAEEKNFALIRVHGEPFTVGATGLVAAHLDGHIGSLEGSALVIRAKHGRVAPAIDAGGQIYALGIVGVHGNALDAGQGPIRRANPIGDGNPPLRGIVPAIGTADVGARIHQTFLAGMRNDAGDEPAAAHDHVAPHVRPG